MRSSIYREAIHDERKEGRKNYAYTLSAHRAPVNIYRNGDSYELLVFAPGRVKENFTVDIQGNELKIRYEPSDSDQYPDWVRKEYSRGWFERSFFLDETIDSSLVKASYTEGVLQVSLPLLPGQKMHRQAIAIQ